MKWFQLFNKTSAPVDTDVPVFSFLLSTTLPVSLGTEFFTQMGAYFSVGIAYGVSSTPDVFTTDTSAGAVTVNAMRAQN